MNGSFRGTGSFTDVQRGRQTDWKRHGLEISQTYRRIPNPNFKARFSELSKARSPATSSIDDCNGNILRGVPKLPPASSRFRTSMPRKRGNHGEMARKGAGSWWTGTTASLTNEQIGCLALTRPELDFTYSTSERVTSTFKLR